MIHLRTSDGDKDLFLRGWLGPNGKKGFVQGRFTAVAGDRQFWDSATAAPPDSLSVSASPVFVQGAGASPVPITAYTNDAVVSVSGGTAPYTYAWAVDVISSGSGWVIANPSGQNTSFSATGIVSGDIAQATFLCTVTDAHGATGTVEVTAQLINYGRL